MEQAQLIADVVQHIIEGFDAYLADFKEITSRAPTRFENRDWHGIQADSKKRLAIYKRQVPRVARKIKRLMAPHHDDLDLWRKIKKAYFQASVKRFSYEIAETYYNSVCRKVIDYIGADLSYMFVEDEHDQREYASVDPIYRTYWFSEDIKQTFSQILHDYQLAVPFENLDRDLMAIEARFKQEVLNHAQTTEHVRIETLKSIFYRNKGAYIVGRIHINGQHTPLIIPLLHEENGLKVDTLMCTEDELSIIFSFTRSYFLVEVAIPSELVHFLKTLMPLKPYGELYNSIGFNKHGKTESYRHFRRHFDESDDKMIVAPGIRGMVMAVFTLPSYNIVFKLIKDRFEPPKQTNKAHVKSRYKLVSQHDRVGRMADTHEFEYFTLPKSRFVPELLAELLEVAPSIVHVNEEEDLVTIDHLYTERRMIPLNMFLESANPVEAEEVIDEYGNTIKQLAAANIFPGDMLLKNFGVTRHRRVVFYDYDEIGFLTDYKFRRLPEAAYEEDEMYDDGGRPWFAVGPNDVFPEEFRYFLVGREDIREIFFDLHNDLFDPRFWIEMQQKQIRGEIVDVFPYRRRRRFSYQEPNEEV
ncbi:MAG: bifunctional isocitrate dehydrogenase kinase/phosphatase [Bacteroidota bacterium]